MRLHHRLIVLLVLAGMAGFQSGCPKTDKPVVYDETVLAVDPAANFVMGVQTLQKPDKNGVIDYTKAYDYFQKAATLGHHPKAHFDAAWVAEVLQRPEDAEYHYGEAYKADKSYKAAMYSYARVLTANGKASTAVEIYKDYLKETPGDFEVRNELITALSNAERYDEALEEAQEILLRDPKNSQVYRSLSAMYYSKGEYGMSQICNEKALSLEEGDAGTYNNMGVTYLLQANEPAAIEAFKTAIKLDPDHFEANTNLGYIALNSGDYGLAKQTLEIAVQVNPASVPAKIGLAVALRGLKEFDRSGALYDEIIKMDPKNEVVYFNASTLHHKYTKDFDKAEAYLDKYVAAHSGLLSPTHEVYAKMEAVKASKVEEEKRKAEEAEKKRLEEERKARNEAMLKEMATSIADFKAKLERGKTCLDPVMVEEMAMFVEQAQIVIDTQDISMAPDIKMMHDEMYGPMLDSGLEGCAEPTPTPPPEGTPPAGEGTAPSPEGTAPAAPDGTPSPEGTAPPAEGGEAPPPG